MTSLAIPETGTLADLIPRPAERTKAITRDVALVAGFAVFTALLAQITIDLSFTPVPVTGQTLGVLLAGTALGWQRGLASQAIYWIAGIFMPVAWYANDETGTSIDKGWNVATGTTAGYFFGFVVAAAAVGWMAGRGQDRDFATSIPAMLAGTAIIYVCGSIWLAHKLDIPIANGDDNALAFGVTPFLIGDAIKLLIAGILAPVTWRLVSRRT
ncbi:MAG: biotin transport system substrate-specific component [Myxococcota bacterium]|jgi:biotin transport system substrate-specific component